MTNTDGHEEQPRDEQREVEDTVSPNVQSAAKVAAFLSFDIQSTTAFDRIAHLPTDSISGSDTTC
jgi:hypothetical protein